MCVTEIYNDVLPDNRRRQTQQLVACHQSRDNRPCPANWFHDNPPRLLAYRDDHQDLSLAQRPQLPPPVQVIEVRETVEKPVTKKKRGYFVKGKAIEVMVELNIPGVRRTESTKKTSRYEVQRPDVFIVEQPRQEYRPLPAPMVPAPLPAAPSIVPPAPMPPGWQPPTHPWGPQPACLPQRPAYDPARPTPVTLHQSQGPPPPPPAPLAPNHAHHQRPSTPIITVEYSPTHRRFPSHSENQSSASSRRSSTAEEFSREHRRRLRAEASAHNARNAARAAEANLARTEVRLQRQLDLVDEREQMALERERRLELEQEDFDTARRDDAQRHHLLPAPPVRIHQRFDRNFEEQDVLVRHVQPRRRGVGEGLAERGERVLEGAGNRRRAYEGADQCREQVAQRRPPVTRRNTNGPRERERIVWDDDRERRGRRWE
ncbi:MAG: hypothetical protein M1829_001335 [Trizodia sp. TS-e1964]|nr:MAG: hypothetical protein M1829_001335 [Trizodia sp. TS-e1964]